MKTSKLFKHRMVKSKLSKLLYLVIASSLVFADNPSDPDEECDDEPTCRDCEGSIVDSDSEDAVSCDTGSFYFNYNAGMASSPLNRNFLSIARNAQTDGIAGTNNSLRTFDDFRNSTFGGDAKNVSAVHLNISQPRITPEIFNPNVLTYNSDRPVEFISEEGVLRQVRTDTLLTDIVITEDGYTLNGYTLDGISLQQDGGIYTAPDSYKLIKSVSVKNPDHPAFNNRALVSIEIFTLNGTRTSTNLYTESNNGDIITQEVFDGIGLDGLLLKRSTIEYINRGEKIWDYSLVRTKEVVEIVDGVIGDLQLYSKTLEEYKDFSFDSAEGGAVNGKRQVKFVRGYGSPNEVTTLKTFHESSDRSINGRLKSLQNADGSWVRWEYAGFSSLSSSIETKYSSFKDVPLSDYKNGLKEQTEIGELKATRTVSVANQLLSKTVFEVEITDEGHSIYRERRFIDGEELIYEKCLNKNDTKVVSGRRTAYIIRPDGIKEVYTYAENDYGDLIISKSVGAGTTSEITDGFLTITTYSSLYQKIAEEVKDIATGLTLSSMEGSDFDLAGRPQKVIYNGNPDDYTEMKHDCCGLAYERRRDGSIITYSRDILKRVFKRTMKTSSTDPHPVVYTTDHSGRTVTKRRSASGTSLLLSQSNTSLNGLEQSILSPDADGDGSPEKTTRVTSYASGNPVTTEIRPDGSKTVKVEFLDGRMKSLTGSGTYPISYDYGTHNQHGGGFYTLQMKGNNTEWVKTYKDQLGRTFLTEYADGATKTVSYHPSSANPGSIGKVSSTTDADGVSVSFLYNAEGERISSARDLPDSQLLITETVENVVADSVSGIGTAYQSISIQNGVTVSTSFRSGDGYSQKTVALNGTSTSTRTVANDGAWTMTSSTPTGNTSVQTYTNGLMQKTESFDNTGAKLTEMSYTYDAFDRALTTTDGRGLVTTMDTYLENNAISQMTDSAGNSTSYTYDPLGRRTITDAPDSLDADGNTLENLTYTAYYPTGKAKAEWGSQTYPKFYAYDALGRLEKLHTYQQDPNLGGNPHGVSAETFQIPAGSAVTTWVYNPQRGFLDRKEYDDGNGTDYTYTAAGRLATRTWARGVSTTYSYEEGQLTHTDYSDDTPDIGYTYDHFGRITEVTRAGVAHASYTFDPNTLQPVTESLNQDTLSAKVLTRSYDSFLRPTGYLLHEEVGEKIVKWKANLLPNAAYFYDSAGRLQKVSDGKFRVATYAYLQNAPSLVESVSSPSHTVVNTYEPNRNILDTKSNQYSDGSKISQFDYTVNAIGQRTDVDRTGSAFASTDSLAWGYDALGQVTLADYGDEALDQSYAYDQIGNRISKGSKNYIKWNDSYKNLTSSYTSNSLNQYTLGKSYDADGNLTEKTNVVNAKWNTTPLSYTYDAENRLVSSSNISGNTTTYQYDYLSRRISKETNGETTHYLYDGWNVIAEYVSTVDSTVSSSLSLTKVYHWGMDLSGSMQGAGGVGGLLKVTDKTFTEENWRGAVYYPTYDGNGNVSEYVDADGAVSAHYEYDAFGNVINSKTTGERAGDFKYKFSTKPRDAETGFYYYGYRYYDPVDGRWLNRDPIEERGGLNVYASVKNNPLWFIDYLGLKTLRECDFTITAGHGWYERDYRRFPGSANRLTEQHFARARCGDRVGQVSCFAGDVNNFLSQEKPHRVIQGIGGNKYDPDIPLYVTDPMTGEETWNRAQPGYLTQRDALGQLESAIRAAQQQALQDCNNKDTCCSKITIDIDCIPGGTVEFNRFAAQSRLGRRLCGYRNTFNCKNGKWSRPDKLIE